MRETVRVRVRVRERERERERETERERDRETEKDRVRERETFAKVRVLKQVPNAIKPFIHPDEIIAVQSIIANETCTNIIHIFNLDR